MSVCSTDGGAGVASASDNGTLHLWKVDYTRRRDGRPERYTSITPGGAAGGADEGAVTRVRPWGPHLLLYTTQHGGLHAWVSPPSPRPSDTATTPPPPPPHACTH